MRKLSGVIHAAVVVETRLSAWECAMLERKYALPCGDADTREHRFGVERDGSPADFVTVEQT